LRRRLGWGRQKYKKARQELIDADLIVLGRGRGGSVSRRRADSEEGTLASAREGDLYPIIEGFLVEEWEQAIEEQRGDILLAQITANPGAVPTGGAWTCPDITLVELMHHKYIPSQIEMEVTTFEVKRHPNERDALLGVYEASAHHRSVHLSYVVLHTSDAISDRVLDEAKRLGVGVRRSLNTGRSVKLEAPVVEPRRHEPAPSDLNAFLENLLSRENRRRLGEYIEAYRKALK